MSFSHVTEDYYKNFIELQEKLRKSEEDRLKLEMKFNEMIQMTGEEEKMYVRKIRSQYKLFLEEDGRRQARNDKILRALERIESRAAVLAAKTERFKLLRKQYHCLLQRVYQAREVQSHKCPDLSPSVQQTTSPSNNMFNKYSKNSNICNKDDLALPYDVQGNIKFTNKGSLDGQLVGNSFEHSSNYVKHSSSSAADKLLQTINSQNYKKENLNSKNKCQFSSNFWQPERCTFNSETSAANVKSNYEKENYCFSNVDSDSEKDVETRKFKITLDNNRIMKSMINNEENDKHFSDRFSKSESVPRVEEHQKKDEIQDMPLKHVPERRTKRQDLRNQWDKTNQDEQNINQLNKSFEESNMYTYNSQNIEEPDRSCFEIKDFRENTDTLNENNKTDENENLSKNIILNTTNLTETESVDIDQIVTSADQNLIQKVSMKSPENDNLHLLHQNEPAKINRENDAVYHCETDERQENKNPLHNTDKENLRYNNNIDDTIPVQYSDNEEGNKDTEHTSGYSANNEMPLDKDNQNIPQYDGDAMQQQHYENSNYIPQYEDTSQVRAKRDGNSEIIPQFDGNGQTIVGQPDTSGEINKQFDQYVMPQYDENGQIVEQYDENGQVIEQYGQNAQFVDQYDESRQIINQYNTNDQFFPQYDENGQIISQYDENGQIITQYDENGQIITQYHESGQIIPQYDENGQIISQYDENGQIIPQYDENGQIIPQYDENGQIIPQYDENGQIIPQFDENGQLIPQYDQNGQLIQHNYEQPDLQYHENNQITHQYDQNEQSQNQYYEGTMYDENGEKIQGNDKIEYNIPTPGEQSEMLTDNNNIINDSNKEAEHISHEITHGSVTEQPENERTSHQFDSNSELSDDKTAKESLMLVNQEGSSELPQKTEKSPSPPARMKVIEMLDTDTESIKQDTKLSNDSDFDFSNG